MVKKLKLPMLLAGFMVASCAGNHGGSADTTGTISKKDTMMANAPDAPPVNMLYCFFHTDGNVNQDTTSVSLLINGNKVTGQMSWQPKEKDARKGTVEGTLKGNAIKAVWAFSQEGMQDTMRVEFELRGNALAQKPYVYDKKTGRQYTNSGAGYSVTYNMKNCPLQTVTPK